MRHVTFVPAVALRYSVSMICTVPSHNGERMIQSSKKEKSRKRYDAHVSEEAKEAKEDSDV